ncbi:MAG: T9SS type A sorting domain-containing protein [Bacteroidota bacterium]
MKKNILFAALVFAGLTSFAQTPRLSLCEEFTGENCGPCASTNPGLNTLLTANAAKIISIKWQVAIPSAPSATWSLYQTNKTEINTRGGYYANSFAPEARIDGQHITTFGGASDHAADITSGVINTSQAITSPFSVTMSRAWENGCNSINVTVTVRATANYTAAANSLRFRTVMVEKTIAFATAPGSNGEKTFYNAGIKSFPTIQNGQTIPNAWVTGQTHTFTINCPIPSYTRNKSEIAFVGFIQNESNKNILQAVMADKVPFPATYSLTAVNAKVDVSCSTTIAPQISFLNNGPGALTSCTIIPFVDGVAGTPTPWTGNLAVSASASVTLNSVTTPTLTGPHSFSYQISTSSPYLLINEPLTKAQYMVASNYQTTPVTENFLTSVFPPTKWAIINPNNNVTWSWESNTGSYSDVNEFGALKFDFFGNTLIGDVDELYLPPVDLSGVSTPTLSFDISKALKNNENDQLDVLVSSNCGVTWTNVYSKAGQVLATTGGVSTAFMPQLPQDWITETIALTGFSSPNVLVKFKVTNDNGNNLYIDNVNLSSSAVGIAKNNRETSSISIFPNPSKGETNVKISSLVAGNANVILINTLGQIVLNKQVALNVGANTIQFDVKELANGLYNVVVETNNGTVSKKLTVSK